MKFNMICLSLLLIPHLTHAINFNFWSSKPTTAELFDQFNQSLLECAKTQDPQKCGPDQIMPHFLAWYKKAETNTQLRDAVFGKLDELTKAGDSDTATDPERANTNGNLLMFIGWRYLDSFVKHNEGKLPEAIHDAGQTALDVLKQACQMRTAQERQALEKGVNDFLNSCRTDWEPELQAILKKESTKK